MTTPRSANAPSGAQSMDAQDDDRDIKLQRASADLLADLERSLKPFLWKTTSSGKTRVRRNVRVRETDRLVNLLEPFQELPQLLDPHLDKLVPVLANAFLTYLQAPPPKTRQPVDSKLLAPLSRSICRLLYTFCKIRGEKVIVRFLSTETRYLELLLSAVEAGDTHAAGSDGWGWEERYITLLWLSQLLLAPFDLSTISSADTVDTKQAAIPNLELGSNVPPVALRVIPLAIRYLSSSGKERDAARILLVRIAMRRDMQELGILQSLVSWAIAELRPTDTVQPAYHYIGVLSFFAGVLGSSVGTRIMDVFLPRIFQICTSISSKENAVFQTIHNSAVARKTIIKVLRSITVLDLSSGSAEGLERVESTIGTLLEYISDSATPVRLAASKALSVITLKLEPEMAAQVVEAVIDSLAAGVKWLDPPVNGSGFQISHANPMEWHGLILTLSHLLYRRSVPSTSLDNILPYLAIGLSFEQRSTSGSSLGANVRDASCFGIWALARRYSTAELESVNIKVASLSSAVPTREHVSALQRLATELVASACLDPAGNIRRGASAALQELIGRHPDTIEEGIQVVQVVDYHAVALRSKAVQQTAPQAAALSSHYYEALRLGLLGWRGVQDSDIAVRGAVAAGLVRVIAASRGFRRLLSELRRALDEIFARLRSVPKREVGHTHGLLLCLASLIPGAKEDVESSMLNLFLQEQGLDGFSDLARDLSGGADIRMTLQSLNDAFSNHKAPELLAEAGGRVIPALYPILRADVVYRWFSSRHQGSSDLDISGRKSLDLKVGVDLLLTPAEDANFPTVEAYLYQLRLLYEDPEELDVAEDQVYPPNAETCQIINKILSQALTLDADACAEVVAEAAASFLLLIGSEERSNIIHDWMQRAASGHLHGQGRAYLRALFKAMLVAGPEMGPQILEVIKSRWTSGQERHDMDTCTTILSSLASSRTWFTSLDFTIGIIMNGIADYTTNARGDVGSLLRIEAVKAAAALWKSKTFDQDSHELFGKVLRVAVEKLDKVRAEAHKAVACALETSVPPTPKEYFAYFLRMNRLREAWILDLFEGYVVTADAGSEDIVRASRAALVEFCVPENIDLVCKTLFSVALKNSTNDRILVSAMEVMAFLFDMGIMQKSSLDWKSFFMFVQKAHYQTKNVRKLEAAIKLYGGLSGFYPPALSKLSGMLLHPYPTIRTLVAEEIFVLGGVGKGFDWGKAKKVDVERLRGELGIEAG